MIPVVIPAYCPSEVLPVLVADLSGAGFDRIVVVDDGSPASYRDVFETLRMRQDVIVLSHERNAGKGAALKTAFRSVLECYPDELGVVTADADGQHAPSDIADVARLFVSAPQNRLVLGARTFADGSAPGRSRLGNAVARVALRLVAGVALADTQTGLRALDRELMRLCLSVPCDRFDFEMAMLLAAVEKGVRIVETPIHTIYRHETAAIYSHFKPIADSLRITAALMRLSGRRRC